MSWGERSCKNSQLKIGIPCKGNCTMLTCNVDCPEYTWDKENIPDSKPKLNKEEK